ncbi:MAG: hypothetical protein KH086_06475 [Coprobacillus sp.]|nr:hypothetical protein [Coprobacillus sp.]
MLTGKKVLVIGLARSGKAAVKLLQKLNATITINEGKELEKIEGYQEYLDAGIEIVAGGHPDELFERFKRADKARTTEGSGLGLSIAKSIVELHGGKMKIVTDGDLFKIIIVLEKNTEEKSE